MITASGVVNLNHPTSYLDWGFIKLSVPNVIVILAMVVLFVLALVLPFPGGED